MTRAARAMLLNDSSFCVSASIREVYLQFSLTRNLCQSNSIFEINFHRRGNSCMLLDQPANNRINVFEKHDSNGTIGKATEYLWANRRLNNAEC